jgi:hypothetical protein
MTDTKCLAAAGLLLSTSVVAWAQNAAEPPPKPDPGTTVQADCIDENDGYVMRGKQPMFVIQLENKCERRLSCKVFAYVTSAKGVAQGHGTLTLAAKSAGAAAKKSFTMRAKMVSGNSQSMRECRVI